MKYNPEQQLNIAKGIGGMSRYQIINFACSAAADILFDNTQYPSGIYYPTERHYHESRRGEGDTRVIDVSLAGCFVAVAFAVGGSDELNGLQNWEKFVESLPNLKKAVDILDDFMSGSCGDYSGEYDEDRNGEPPPEEGEQIALHWCSPSPFAVHFVNNEMERFRTPDNLDDGCLSACYAAMLDDDDLNYFISACQTLLFFAGLDPEMHEPINPSYVRKTLIEKCGYMLKNIARAQEGLDEEKNILDGVPESLLETIGMLEDEEGDFRTAQNHALELLEDGDLQRITDRYLGD